MNNSAPNKPKVFCIGFNKTGTFTYKSILQQCMLKTCHNTLWQQWTENHDIEALNKYDAYTDGQMKDFEWLDKTFPGSKFILNTRPLKDWLLSRHCHVEKNKLNPNYHGGWLDNSHKAIQNWIKLRHDYHTKVLNYFQNRNNDFVILDLQTMLRPEIHAKLTKLFRGFPKAKVPGRNLLIHIKNPTKKSYKEKGRPFVNEAMQMYGLNESQFSENIFAVPKN